MRVFGKATNWLVNQIRSTIDIRKIYRFLSLIKNQNMYLGTTLLRLQGEWVWFQMSMGNLIGFWMIIKGL